MKNKYYFTPVMLLLILIVSMIVMSCAPPVEEKCPIPDGSKITVSRGTAATGGMIINGAPGAVQPGATVTITDEGGRSVTTTADQNGAFTLMEADLPMDFDHTLGNELSVTQNSEGCTQSDAVDVPIEA